MGETVERDCIAAATRFFHHLDRGDYAGVAALIAEDGVWVRQGKELVGPGAVLDALRARPADFVTRHLLSNVLVDITGDGEATVAYELSVYGQTGAEPPRHLSIMTGEDRLVRTEAGWRIRSKRARPVFSFKN